MLKIITNGVEKSKVKEIITNNSFFNDFRFSETEEGFELDGMKYCTISTNLTGPFTLIGKQDKLLADVVSDAFKDYPEVEIKGALLLGDDNYRQYYWMYSAAGETETTIDYAIGIDEFRSLVDSSNIGIPLESAWYYCLYDSEYGEEYLYFRTIDDLKESVASALSNFDIDKDDKKLGLDLMEIYKFISEIMDMSASNIQDLKSLFEGIKKKYEKDIKSDDEVSCVIRNNLVPMASAISWMTVYEVWANAVKKKLSKSRFFKMFKIDADLEDLENDDYIELLAQLAEDYGGFAEIECEDFIGLCDDYGISSEIDEDEFEDIKERLDNMEIPEIDEEFM